MKTKRDTFSGSVRMDTQTQFDANGGITIFPASYELDRHHLLEAGQTRVTQRGRMTTDDDGRSSFLPYAHGGGSRYQTLLKTRHGVVRMTSRSVVFSVAMPKQYGKALIKVLLGEEFVRMRAFANAQTDATDQWQPHLEEPQPEPEKQQEAGL